MFRTAAHKSDKMGQAERPPAIFGNYTAFFGYPGWNTALPHSLTKHPACNTGPAPSPQNPQSRISPQAQSAIPIEMPPTPGMGLTYEAERMVHKKTEVISRRPLNSSTDFNFTKTKLTLYQLKLLRNYLCTTKYLDMLQNFSASKIVRTIILFSFLSKV